MSHVGQAEFAGLTLLIEILKVSRSMCMLVKSHAGYMFLRSLTLAQIPIIIYVKSVGIISALVHSNVSESMWLLVHSVCGPKRP